MMVFTIDTNMHFTISTLPTNTSSRVQIYLLCIKIITLKQSNYKNLISTYFFENCSSFKNSQYCTNYDQYYSYDT